MNAKPAIERRGGRELQVGRGGGASGGGEELARIWVAGGDARAAVRCKAPGERPRICCG